MKTKLLISVWVGLQTATLTLAASQAPESETTSDQAARLSPFTITAPYYGAIRTPREIAKVQMFYNWLGFGSSPYNTGSYVRTPGKVFQKKENAIFSTQVASRSALLDAPTTIPKGILYSDHGFGVSRSGSSNALALLDGVPLNDPFGGAVHWSMVPTEGLFQAESIPGGSVVPWGNGTTGGIIQFITKPATGKLVVEQGQPNDGGPVDPKLKKQVVRGSGQFSATLGEFNTRDLEFVMDHPTHAGVMQFLGREFSTDGYHLVAANQRGAIDTPAWNRHHWLTARWHQPLGKEHELTSTIRSSQKARGGGTPYQREDSRRTLASAAISGSLASGFIWDGLIYFKKQSHSNSFSSVDTSRTTETPVFEHVSIPTSSLGVSWVGSWWNAGHSRTTAGMDIRHVKADPRESYLYNNGSFTRERTAQGQQKDIGLFVLHNRAITSSLHATLGLRLNRWSEPSANHFTKDRISQKVLQTDTFAAISETRFYPSIGVVWQPNNFWLLRANTQKGFRTPTLGERFEIAGHHAVIVAPNHGLRTEHNTRFEVSVEYTPLSAVKMGATAYSNDRHDTLGQLTVSHPSPEFAAFNGLPSGYILRKRINYDHVDEQGLELSTSWKPQGNLSLAAKVLFTKAIVRRATIAPDIVGNRLPHVPAHQAMLSAKWSFPRGPTMRLQLHSMGQQYDNSENTISFDRTVLANFEVTYPLSQHCEISLKIENLTNERVDTGYSTDGIVYTGSKRTAHLGLRMQW